MKIPYSLREAEAICGELQHLVGSFSEHMRARIENVVVSPYDQHNKQRFFMYYHLLHGDASAALQHEYKGLLFDVVVVARDEHGQYHFEDAHPVFSSCDSRAERIRCALSSDRSTPSYL